jgi:predicted RNase H-like nuclease (RuvC/YqgF family)
MARKAKGKIEVLEDENLKLKKAIRSKDKTIRQLKSEVETAKEAFRQTETYLKEITNDRPLSEIIKTVVEGKPLKKIKNTCPKCGSEEMKKIIYTGFHVISCKCGYRNRVDEEQEINTNK